MALLFDIRNDVVMPKEELLLIPPFSDIWKRDRSKNKSRAIKEFSYIEFMASPYPSNPYRNFEEEAKKKKITDDIFGGKYEPDDIVEEAIRKIREYYENMSYTYRYYIIAKKTADRILNFVNSVDFKEVNNKTGLPLWKPKDISSALSDVEVLISKINKMEKRLWEELQDSERTLANKKISPFSIPDKQ